MRSARYTGQFKRDVKLASKRGKDLSKLRRVMVLLLEGLPLPRELGDHPLKGEWKPSNDCHIEADWIVIYSIDIDTICFERTGTHADLFG